MTDKRPILLPAPPPDDDKAGASRTSPDNIDVDETLPMAPPKMWTRGFMILCAAVVAILYMLLHEVSTTLEMHIPMGTWLVPIGVAVLLVMGRKLLMPSSPRVISFGADIVELPRGRNSRRTYKLAYEEIRTIVPLVSRGQPALVIGGKNKTHVFVASDFSHPETWRVLWAQLMDRIARRPGANAQIQKMRQLSDLSQETSSIQATFTKRLFWVIAAVFAAQVFLSPSVDVLEYLYFGANSRVMVLEELQLWRIVTANLLHGNGIHFGVNAFALYFLGTYCERLFGQRQTVVLILGTAILGAMASLIGAQAMFAVGISTALFGLLGAYFGLHLRFEKQLPPPYRQSRMWWSVILGLNIVLSVAVPMIDAWGHFGGFGAGLVLGWWMTAGQQNFKPKRSSGFWLNLSAAILIAVFAASSVLAIGYALGDHPDDEITIAQTLLDRSDEEDPALLAQISHNWSQYSPRPSNLDPILVALAEAAHERSDDLYTQWRAAATIIRLAEEMAQPFDRDVMQRGIMRFEQAAWGHDDQNARRALGRMLVEFVNDIGTLYAADSPVQSAQITDGGVALSPGGIVDNPHRIYVLTVDEDAEDRTTEFLLHRCLQAGDLVDDQIKPVDRDLDPAWSLRLAMVTEAEECSDDEARIWRSTSILELSSDGSR